MLATLGFVLRKIGIFTSDFLKIATTFSFRISFPALLFINVYKIKHIAEVRWDLVLFMLVAELVVFVIGLLYVLLFVKNPRQKGVILQMFFRSNYIIIGIPLAYSRGGSEGGAIALMIFLPHEGKSKNPLRGIWVVIKKILTNPLILATVADFICLLIRPYVAGWNFKTGEFGFLFQTIESIANIAAPFALITLGGGFSFSGTKLLLPHIIQGVAIRLIIVPLFVFFMIRWLFPHFGAAEHATILLLFAVPTTVTSAIMAEKMGSDGELARQLVVWTSICSVFTLLIFTTMLRSSGIFLYSLRFSPHLTKSVL